MGISTDDIVTAGQGMWGGMECARRDFTNNDKSQSRFHLKYTTQWVYNSAVILSLVRYPN